jgi:hypothetical protein
MITNTVITLRNTYCFIIFEILHRVITKSNDGETGVVYEVVLNELLCGLLDLHYLNDNTNTVITIAVITLSDAYCNIILEILPGVVTESNDSETGIVYEVISNKLLGSLVDPLPQVLIDHGGRGLDDEDVLGAGLADDLDADGRIKRSGRAVYSANGHGRVRLDSCRLFLFFCFFEVDDVGFSSGKVFMT